MVLPNSLWQQHNNNTTISSSSYSSTHPLSLSDKYFNQLDAVYTSCIHPSQFLPQLFTSTNATSLFNNYIYIGNISSSNQVYTSLMLDSIPQHCKYTILSSGNLFVIIII